MTAVTSAIDFLATHDATLLGKPYSLRYEPHLGIPKTNFSSQPHQQRIEDVRGAEKTLSVATHGFELLNLEPVLAYDDFDTDQLVQSVFYKHVAHAVKRALGATRVQIFEHVLRKRHQQFPIATGEPYQYDQPTTRAHLDLTPAWGTATAEHMNEERGTPMPSTDFKFVNIWKPLHGPVQDWPLALCDVRTVQSTDLVPSDLVYPATVVENCLVKANPRQKWYYISGQTADEAWMFIQSDSREQGQLGVPHSSFLHPDSAKTDRPRESIEVRAIAYF